MQNVLDQDLLRLQPSIAVITSAIAEEACFKNNLTFVQLLQPFSKLSADAHFRDSSGISVSIKNLRLNICDINWRPPQTMLARKMLNESVSSANCDKHKDFKINQNVLINIPDCTPWFENWRETFLSVQFPSDHEFTRHFLSCLIVVSSSEPNPVDMANQLTKKVQMLQNVTPPKLPKWFSSDTLNCYVMIHDASSGDLSRAQQGFEGLKTNFGDNKCFLIQINSQKDNKTDNNPDPWLKYLKKYHKNESNNLDSVSQDSAPRTPQDINITQLPSSVQMSQLESPLTNVSMNANEVAHPLSPMQENGPEITIQQPTLTMSASSDSLTLQAPMNPNVWQNEVDQIDLPHGMLLSSADIDNLKHFVQDFTVRALVPYVEKMVQTLNDSITNKKSVSKSLIGATKRWFVTNKTTTQNAVVYTADSSELQTRKLGDLYYMFGNYNLAFQAYHQAKRDFNADSAWQYYAGALEMAALSAFMQGTANRKTFDYMEEAISTYLTVCKLPQFATRSTLLSVECLKSAGLFIEAAKQLTRMTSEDSDLRSALLLEQAAYCFLMSQPPFYRKYAFHSVLSGHRYSKAGQRKHAFRLYKQAEQIFSSKGWNLAEDHIQYTISKQAITLKKMEEAAVCLSHLLRPSSLQSTQQQNGFLREYLATQKTLISQTNSNELLNISVPKIVQNSVRVLVTSPLAEAKDDFLPATNIDITNSFDDEWQWHKLEEMVVQAGLKKSLMVFKPSKSLYTGENPTTEHPLCVFGEPVEVSFVLENPIKPSILFEDICLLWEFKKETGELFSNRNLLKNGEIIVDESVISATSVKCVEFSEYEKHTIKIVLLAKFVGYLRIVGVAGRISSTIEKSPIWGKLNFEKIPLKINDTPINSKLDYDRKLEIQILQPTSALMVSFSPIPKDVLCGEIVPIKMSITNVGSNVLDSIYLATDSPRHLLMNPEESDLPLSMAKDLRDISNENFNKDREIRKQYVYKIADETGPIIPNENRIISLWLQAPFKKGSKSIKIILFYNVSKDYPKLKYRLVRHVFDFVVNECLSAEVNCNVANEVTSELGLDISFKNVNQTNSSLTTNLHLGKIHLYCSEYTIDADRIYYIKNPSYEKIFKNSESLVGNDSLNLRCILNQRNEIIGYDGKSTFLEFINRKISLLQLKDFESFEVEILNMKYLGNFLIKNETKYLPFSQQNVTNEDLNNILNSNNKHMTLCITWKALVFANGIHVRNAFGQHFVHLKHLFESIHCPPKERIVQSSFTSHDEIYDIFTYKNSIESVPNESSWPVEKEFSNVANRCMLELI